jgi:hypothetical protein
MPVTHGKSSSWWEGFELFIPMKHPMSFKEHVLCKGCSQIVKVGESQSTSNLRSLKEHHHPTEYETITKGLNKISKNTNGEGGVLPTSILKMPGTRGVNAIKKCMRNCAVLQQVHLSNEKVERSAAKVRPGQI